MKYFKLYLVLGLLQFLLHKQKGLLIIPFTTAVHPAQGRVSEVPQMVLSTHWKQICQKKS